MLKHFQPSATAGVLVVGDIILDRYVFGDTERVSPEAPVPVVRVQHTEQRPGGAANVAMNVRSLGLDTALLGVTGNDEESDVLERLLAGAGIEARLCRQDGFPTTTKQRILSRHQQLLRLDYEIASERVDAAVLMVPFREMQPGHQVVVLSDYAKGSLHGVGELIEHARRQGAAVLVDPKGADFSRYRGASVLTPNLKEFEAVAGACGDDLTLASRARALCAELDIEAILITRGERGMSLVGRDRQQPLHLAAHTHEVFDVTGAGDTVIAALAAALASGSSLDEAVAYANLAAGLVVEKLGTATVTSAELNIAISGGQGEGGRDKILDAERLETVIEAQRERGARIVMTNGCFDILHAGHIDCLERAAKLGECLIVAVNDDASVARLKGPGRPVNALQERLTVLAALSAVDWVVPFAEDTPEALIRRIRPDCLVKGGDYSPDQIAGADYVHASGGEVVVLPLKAGCSSSRILAAGGHNPGEHQA